MSEKKTEMVVMTQEQFTALITKLTEAHESGNRQKSFAACTKRDEDALEGLTLLLSGAAATWWNGVKSDIKKWSQALDVIKSAFAPKMQQHEIYLEVYSKRQTTESIEAFLPAKRHKEEEHLDFVYGLLNITNKKEIARTEIKTFAELLERGRHNECLAKEAGEVTVPTPLERKPPKRYSFCGKKGHLFELCRKRLAEEKEKAASTDPEKKPVITCYGCGAPGVYRSNCATCKTKETPPKPVAFCSVEKHLKIHAKIPTIKACVNCVKDSSEVDQCPSPPILDILEDSDAEKAIAD
uniref:SFRICE_010872 n=1 Tax=Spodoptera frugiperda TaxID=7108 RepID=A0A2H1WJ00_SPOFR